MVVFTSSPFPAQGNTPFEEYNVAAPESDDSNPGNDTLRSWARYKEITKGARFSRELKFFEKWVKSH
jgi:hypothetical protein